jgi:hypothetical protein
MEQLRDAYTTKKATQQNTNHTRDSHPPNLSLVVFPSTQKQWNFVLHIFSSKAEHGVHTDAPFDDHVPAGQFRHVLLFVAPVWDEYVSAEHGVHSDAPFDDHVPAAQFRHSSMPAAPLNDHVPAGQERQDATAPVSPKDPAGQDTQVNEEEEEESYE